MMDEEALLAECKAEWEKWTQVRHRSGHSLESVQFTQLLLAFAKRQRAAGIREAQGMTFDWSEARAKALEEGA